MTPTPIPTPILALARFEPAGEPRQERSDGLIGFERKAQMEATS